MSCTYRLFWLLQKRHALSRFVKTGRLPVYWWQYSRFHLQCGSPLLCVILVACVRWQCPSCRASASVYGRNPRRGFWSLLAFSCFPSGLFLGCELSIVWSSPLPSPQRFCETGRGLTLRTSCDRVSFRMQMEAWIQRSSFVQLRLVKDQLCLNQLLLLLSSYFKCPRR